MGIEGPRRDPESFSELLLVTKTDHNNFPFLQFVVSGGVGRLCPTETNQLWGTENPLCRAEN